MGKALMKATELLLTHFLKNLTKKIVGLTFLVQIRAQWMTDFFSVQCPKQRKFVSDKAKSEIYFISETIHSVKFKAKLFHYAFIIFGKGLGEQINMPTDLAAVPKTSKEACYITLSN